MATVLQACYANALVLMQRYDGIAGIEGFLQEGNTAFLCSHERGQFLAECLAIELCRLRAVTIGQS